MDQFLERSCDSYFSRFHHFERGSKLHKTLMSFCKNPCEDTAESVYTEFLYVYRLNGLKELVDGMHRFEVTSSTLLPSHRDHYVHTVYVFLLGLSIFESNENVRNVASNTLNYPDEYNSIEEEFLYRWGIASLFHDVGYPLQIAYGTIQEFTTTLISPSLSYNDGEITGSSDARQQPKEPVAVLNFPKLDNLLHINILPPLKKYEVEYYQKYPFLKNPPDNLIDAISRNISTFGFAKSRKISKKINDYLQDGLKDGFVDHGIYSSIILLKWTNEAFSKSKSSWNPAYYYIPIMDSATAIFLHNAYEYLFQIPPFNLGPLSANHSLISFLLMLCDKLQETNRKSYGYNNKGVDYTSTYLYIDDTTFHLILFISKNEDMNLIKLKIEEMERSIKKVVDISPIFQKFKIEIGVKNHK